MKIRIKFEKTGPVRFVGHLDFQRTFQKILKKSSLEPVYTSGFNPHIVLSFAVPLGVGEETLGDYADVEFAYRDFGELDEQEKYRLSDIGLDNDALPAPPVEADFLNAFNEAAPEGIKAVSAVRVGVIKHSKAGALVRNAAFRIYLKDGFLSDLDGPMLETCLHAFVSQESIRVKKVTKSGEKVTDIRPLIGRVLAENGCSTPAGGNFGTGRVIMLECAQGSARNLKPGVFLEALSAYVGANYDPSGCRIRRIDLFDENMTPLSELGEHF